MRLGTVYYPCGEFYCFFVSHNKTTHYDTVEYKSIHDAFRAGAQWILDNL